MSRLTAWLAANWRRIAEWLAWAAWNRARTRAIKREAWLPGEAQEARTDMSPDQRRIIANEARQVLENRHFIAAWNALNAALEAHTMSCDPDNKEKAARLVISKQLLHGLRREFIRKVEDGYMAEVELQEIEQRKQRLKFVR